MKNQSEHSGVPKVHDPVECLVCGEDCSNQGTTHLQVCEGCHETAIDHGLVYIDHGLI